MPGRKSEEALVGLIRDRGEALTRYAFLLTGDVAAAQDLVQDALVKVFVRTRSGFTPDVMEAYLRRAIVNVYLDGRRRGKQWTDVQHLLVGDDVRHGPETATADRLDLHAALGTLAPQERAAVVLRFFGELTVPEVADQMGISQGSIKRYLSNAIGKLEQRLGPMPSLRSTPDTVAVATRRGGRS
jgi:RNA polymerase sigma factor (sigma-70 family)